MNRGILDWSHHFEYRLQIFVNLGPIKAEPIQKPIELYLMCIGIAQEVLLRQCGWKDYNHGLEE